jgi:hypothetical protein
VIKKPLCKQLTQPKSNVAIAIALWLVASVAVAAGVPEKAPSPTVFIQGIYAKYQNLKPGTYPPFLLDKTQRKSYFAERFIKALERDERCTPPGDMGTLGADIFLATQDYGDRGIGPVSIKALGQNRFEIKFDVFPENPPAERYPSKVKMQLVMQNGTWRIANIDDALESLDAAPCATEDAVKQ